MNNPQITRTMTEDEFWAKFKPQLRPNGELKEYEDVKDLDPTFVWSIVETGDDEDENWYATPGFHVVNMMGYVTSETPHDFSIPCAVYFDATDFITDNDNKEN